jgi:hypothetical protein
MVNSRPPQMLSPLSNLKDSIAARSPPLSPLHRVLSQIMGASLKDSIWCNLARLYLSPLNPLKKKFPCRRAPSTTRLPNSRPPSVPVNEKWPIGKGVPSQFPPSQDPENPMEWLPQRRSPLPNDLLPRSANTFYWSPLPAPPPPPFAKKFVNFSKN